MKKLLCFFLVVFQVWVPYSLSYAGTATFQEAIGFHPDFVTNTGEKNKKICKNSELSISSVFLILLSTNKILLSSFINQSLADAEDAIVAAGLAVGTVTSAYSDTVSPGNIISQDPPPYTYVSPGTKIDLIVSRGPAIITVPNVVGMTQTEAENSIEGALLTVGGITTEQSDTIPLDHIISQNPAAGSMVANGTSVNLVCSLGDLPPDPRDVAPALNPKITTTTISATEFIYSGSDPIQTGVSPGTIEPKRVAVIRGKVLNKQNQPLPGVIISILNHPEFGKTISRADGIFDMVVNGGGLMTVNYIRQGHLQVQRQINVPWQDYVWLPDVVMVQMDSKVTTVDLGNTSTQVAQGSITTDSDGTRQATLLFPQGTNAELVLPDGSTKAITTLNVRATEYTVGENGPMAMPAAMPADVGYTYAVELSVDEAQAAGAKRVDFNKPIPFYVDNFLGFPIGGAVPLGYYDTDLAVWVPSQNGRVIKILAIQNGMAAIDTDGDNVVDNDPSLGITDDERSHLAALYPIAGKSLWRMQLSHFSTWDANWGWGGPPGAKPLQLKDQIIGFLRDNHVGCILGNCEQFGSVIESQNQILGEEIGIAGTQFALHYRNDRVKGRKTPYTINIPVSTDTLPPELKRIDLVVSVAGCTFMYSLPAATNQIFPFTWDGMDAYGRDVQGIQPVRVRIGYVYDGYYQGVSQMMASFGYKGNGVPLDVNSRGEFIMWRDLDLFMGAYRFHESAVGSWTLNMHHVYDPVGRMLYLGDGSKRSAQGINEVMELVAGTGSSGFSGDGGLATSARINLPHDVAVAPDGSIFFADCLNSRVRKVDTDGLIHTVMTGLNYPIGVTVGLDGSVYVAEYFGHQIKRLRPDNVVEIFVGTGVAGFSGDGGSASAAQLNHPQDLDVGLDGSLYITDTYNHRIRRVGPDGIIQTVAGTGVKNYGGDGGPATQADLNTPCRLHIATDGILYIADTYNHRIRKIATDGIISTVAGTGTAGYTGDNGLATAARIDFPNAVSTSPDGSVYIGDYNNDVIRRVSPDNIITTVAGTGVGGSAGVGSPARQAQINGPSGLAFAADGSYYISDRNTHRILRIRPPLPGFSNNDLAIPAKDGGLLYHFDANGRHLRTVNANTGGTLYQFTYDTAGRLITITDGDNKITTIELDVHGDPKAIISHFGQRSTVTLDANGYLATITNPLAHQYQMTYTNDGLLTEFQDPRGYVSSMTYDSQGRLLKDQNAANGYTELARTENQDNYLVTSTSSEGRVNSYQVAFLSEYGQKRINQFPDGSQNEVLIANDGSTQTTLADGTVSISFGSADPRFGMQAPFIKKLTTTTGSLTSILTSQRSVNLNDPADPMSMISQTDSTTINGHTTNRFYDAATRTTTITSPMGRQYVMTVDNQGRPLQINISGINPVNLAYDGLGNLNQLAQGTRESNFTYDPVTGYQLSLSNVFNQTTTYNRDHAGRITSLTHPDSTIWSYEWDEMDNLSIITEPNGTNQHRFTYTPGNLLETYQSPLGAVERFTYNKDRHLIRREYPSGSGVDLNYNVKGQLTTIQSPQGNHSFSYNDNTGQLIQAVSRDGQTVDYSYNGGLLSSAGWSNVVTGTAAWEYDNFFRVSRMTYPGVDISMTYDGDGLLTGAGSVALGRNVNNGLVETLSDGAYTIAYGRNSFGEINDKTVFHGASLYAVTYTRDDLGRITQRNETIGSTAHVWKYEYDAVGQLRSVKLDDITVETYDYDAVGNRTIINNTLIGVSLTADDFTYDADNKLQTAGTTNYTYDTDGHLSQENRLGSITGYHYNTDGTLATVTMPDNKIISYLYDVQGRRIARSVDGVRTHAWLYGNGLMPLAEFDGSGNLQKSFIYADGATPTSFIAGGETFHIISDLTGSPRMIVDSSGTVVRQIDYDAFGNVVNDTNPTMSLVFGFAGGMTDPDHELIRFGARDYQPSTGRWTAKDSILFWGGMNLYGYVKGDPVNWVDRYGSRGKVSRSIENMSWEDAYDIADMMYKTDMSIGRAIYQKTGEIYEGPNADKGWTFAYSVAQSMFKTDLSYKQALKHYSGMGGREYEGSISPSPDVSACYPKMSRGYSLSPEFLEWIAKLGPASVLFSD